MPFFQGVALGGVRRTYVPPYSIQAMLGENAENLVRVLSFLAIMTGKVFSP